MSVIQSSLSVNMSVNPFPQRIISLVPSLTELLFDLGLEETVVGITKFCIHPEAWFRNKQRIGGTKNIDIERIRALKPDLIIANKEENIKEQVDQLSLYCNVIVTDIKTITDNYAAIQLISESVGTKEAGDSIINKTQEAFLDLDKYIDNQFFKEKKVAYFIWKDPWMTVGNDTFIHQIIKQLRWKNVFEQLTRYPTVTLTDLALFELDYILLSSEPYPFKDADVALLQNQFPNIKIILVNGEFFSWYGSRMQKTPQYLKQLLKEI